MKQAFTEIVARADDNDSRCSANLGWGALFRSTYSSHYGPEVIRKEDETLEKSGEANREASKWLSAIDARLDLWDTSAQTQKAPG